MHQERSGFARVRRPSAMKVEGDLSRGTRRGDNGDAASDVDSMPVEVSGEYGEDIHMARNHVELSVTTFEPVVIHESDSGGEGRVMLHDDGRLPISELTVEEFEAFLAEEATVGVGLNGVDNEKSGTPGPVENSEVVFELPAHRGKGRGGRVEGAGEIPDRLAIVMVAGNQEQATRDAAQQLGEVVVLVRFSVVNEVATQNDQVRIEGLGRGQRGGETVGGVDATLHQLPAGKDVGVADLNDDHSLTLGCPRGRRVPELQSPRG